MTFDCGIFEHVVAACPARDDADDISVMQTQIFFASGRHSVIDFSTFASALALTFIFSHINDNFLSLVVTLKIAGE